MPPSIYNYIKIEENKYETDEIQVGENWFWNMRRHVQMIFHLVNGVFYTGANDYLRAVKNIMEPILNLAFWTEDLEVKDVMFFIENGKGRVLSFFLKKYHDEVYTREHNLDTLFDEIAENDLTYGGVLVQKTDTVKPEVLPLNSIAFCDQTDILGGPLAFKYNFSPDKLRQMSKLGWGSDKNGATISIEDLIVLAQPEKTPAGTINKQTNQTTGKSIEVYIVKGNLPEHYLKDNDNMEDHYNQVHIVAFYLDEKNKRQGVTLYRKKEEEGGLKFFTSKKVYGRALGRGEGEALIHPQIWTNCLTIWKHQMLEAASKVPLYTDDQNYTTRNKIQDMENLEITTIEDGKIIRQVPTAAPANVQLFSQSINEWYDYSQLTGSAFDPLMGKEANSGTTFRGQERVIQQGRGIHDRRRGQRAKFIEEIYRDWIIPDMVKEIKKGKKFLATLTNEEMRWVADELAINYSNERLKELLLEGKMPTKENQDTLIEMFKQTFTKGGNKKLLEVLGKEFEGVEVKMGINIAGKQKNLADLSDKVLNIIQFAMADPQKFQMGMQIPALAQAFEDILEFSGLNQASFNTLLNAAPPTTAQPMAAEMPELSLNTTE